MKSTHTLWSLAALAAASVAHADVNVNGGFEAGTGADADNWNQLEIFGGAATASTRRVSGSTHSGDWAMEMIVSGAPDFGPVAEIQQQTAVGSVVAGAEYTFSFWAAGAPGPGSVAFYEILWFDGDASHGGGPQGSATNLQSFAYGPDWGQISFTGMVAPDGADSALIQIRLVTGAFDGAAGQMMLDDVSFAVVPAPAGLALLGLGALTATRPRR